MHGYLSTTLVIGWCNPS